MTEPAKNAAETPIEASAASEPIKLSPLLITLGILALLVGLAAGLVLSQATFSK